MTRRRSFLSLAAAVVAVALSSCATVPLTGRQQLDFVPQADLAALGAESYREVLSQATLSSDPVATQMVADCGRRVAGSAESFMREQGLAADLPYYQWEFNLIEDDSVANAFCLPGGKIAVYSGILPIARDEAGLSVVVAHEIAHAIANHSGERMSQLLLAELGGMALSRALEEKPQRTRELAMLAYGLGANVGVLLPYSRRHESEADRIGLILMARAAFHPETAVRFWQDMAAANPAAVPEFLSTHPAPATRIQEIRSNIPEAMRYYTP